METLEAIRTRRSVRRFTPDPVEEETLREILSAAMQAPSAANEQPWEFVLIRNRGMLDSIALFHPFGAMAKKAPCGILVCVDTRRLVFPGFWVQDCAAATQNVLLAAHDRGLGAVWTGVYPLEERMKGFTELCHLPEYVTPFALVIIGHPAERPEAEDRFRADRVHDDAW